MRHVIVISPDSFKGTASASEVALAIAEGWRTERPDDDLVLCPMADGGEGTLDAFEFALPGAVREPVQVDGPDDERVESYYLRLPDGSAVVELSSTSGLTLLKSACSNDGSHVRFWAGYCRFVGRGSEPTDSCPGWKRLHRRWFRCSDRAWRAIPGR